MFYAFLINWTLQLNFNYSSRIAVVFMDPNFGLWTIFSWTIFAVRGVRHLGVFCNCHIIAIPIFYRFWVTPLPIFDDICKRSMRFIANCVASPSHLVKSISWHCILFGRQRSLIGSNALFCCERYKWSMIEFINNSSEFNNFPFNSLFYDSLTEMQKNSASFLFELLSIREGHIFLPQSFLSYEQLSDIIDFISTV